MVKMQAMTNGTNGTPNESQALVRRDAPQSMAIVPTTLADVQTFIKMLVESPLLPEELRRNTANVAMVVMRGMELGIPPVQSLSMFHVIKGKVALHATAKRGLCMSRAGCKFEYPVLTNEQVTVRVTRPNFGTIEITWTFADAVKAGLPNSNPNWNKYPRKMLVARATSEACDFIAADVVAGLPVVEDVEDYDDPDPRGAGGQFQPTEGAEGKARAPRQTKPKEPPPAAPGAVIDTQAVEKPAAAPPAAAAPAAGSTTPSSSAAPTPSSPPPSQPASNPPTSSTASGSSPPAADDTWGDEPSAPAADGDPLARFASECNTAPDLITLAAVRKEWGDFAKANAGLVPQMKEIYGKAHAALQAKANGG